MRKSTWILSIALLASIASAAWLWQALRGERARNVELGAQLERQAIDLRRESAVENSIEKPAPAPVAVAAAPSPAATATTPVSSSKDVNGTENDWLAYRRRLLNDPKYRQALREQERLNLAPRRANLIRLLGFTPEQADATIDLDIDEMLRLQEKGWRQVRPQQAAKEYRAQYEAMQREQQDKLRALLGEEKRLRLQGYMESRESRVQVEDLRSGLTEANALRDDQIEPLIAALHAERAQMQSELYAFRDTLSWEGVNEDSWRLFGERKAELTKSMNSRMLASASSVLTQSQLNALEEQMRRDQAQLEAQQRMRRIQSKLNQANQPGVTSN